MHKLFPSQAEDERIHIVVREHWLRLVGRILIWFVFVGIMLVFNFYAKAIVPGLLVGTLGKVTDIFRDLYILFLILALFLIWIHYYLNVQIITDRRIVDIDQVGLFSHVVSELHIENIEDVTSKTTGIVGNLFNFGMVYVQTAGSKERFEFNYVPNPGSINKLLLDLYEKLPHHERVHKG